MKYKVDILIAHPGKHHALHLVAGCIKSGATVRFVTPFYRCGLGKLVSFLPGKIGSKAKGYFHPDIPVSFVISPFAWQVRQLILIFKQDPSYDPSFDFYMAGEIERGRYEAKVLVALQDYMPATVNAAKKRGWKIWSDQISNQSNEMALRIAKHEQALGLNNIWKHSEKHNDEILAAADVITVPSSYTLDGIKHRVVAGTRVVTITYGASAKRFSGDRIVDDQQTIILARAQSVRKGGHLLLQAIQQSAAELLKVCVPKKIKVVLLGSMELALSNMLKEIKLPVGMVIEHGNVPHADVARLYQQASLFVMPSLSESMSLACVEALHAGLPLIITKYCGIDGFASGEMGYEVQDNTESLAAALVEAFNNQHLWLQWGYNSRQLATQLTWDAYEQRVSQLAQKVLS